MLVPHLSSALRQAQTDLSQNTTCLSVCLLICFSCVWLFVTPGTVAYQAPLSMRMSRQEYWSALPCPPLRDLPNPRIEPTSPAAPTLQEDSLPLSHWKSPTCPRLDHWSLAAQVLGPPSSGCVRGGEWPPGQIWTIAHRWEVHFSLLPRDLVMLPHPWAGRLSAPSRGPDQELQFRLILRSPGSHAGRWRGAPSGTACCLQDCQNQRWEPLPWDTQNHQWCEALGRTGSRPCQVGRCDFRAGLKPEVPSWVHLRSWIKAQVQKGLLLFSRSVMSDSLWPHGLQHTRLPCPFIISQSLLKLMSVESVMPSNHLILCHPLSLFPSIKVFSSELALHIRWPKYWSCSFSISPSSEYSGLISFRIDWLGLLAV